jgi:hypothetical protein
MKAAVQAQMLTESPLRKWLIKAEGFKLKTLWNGNNEVSLCGV